MPLEKSGVYMTGNAVGVSVLSQGIQNKPKTHTSFSKKTTAHAAISKKKKIMRDIMMDAQELQQNGNFYDHS